MSSDTFIGLLHEEYKIWINQANNGNHNSTDNSTNLVNTQKAPSTSKSLEARISNRKNSMRPFCDHCKKAGHWMSKCHKFVGNKCHNCSKFGHFAKDCWGKKKDKDKDKRNGGRKPVNESNIVEEEIAFVIDEELHNVDTFDACNVAANDERLIYYEWLANSATTSHITNQQDAFISYETLGNSTVTGVGGQEAIIAGKGTVELISTCNNHEYVLTLKNVLHVPGTRNNLISLGRWDAAGGGGV